MIRFFCAAIFVFSLAIPSLAIAQDAAEHPLTIGEDGQAYIRSIRLKRIDADVAYFDPSAPPPPIEVNAPPEPAEESDNDQLIEVDLPTSLISAAILLSIIYVFVRFGGGLSVTLGREVRNASRGEGGDGASAGEMAPLRPGSLEAILRIPDRRMALIQLAQSVLITVVAQNGLLLQRSWTARDVLRHLPETQSHLNTLEDLVHASERVHFGGRDITETEFQSFVDGVRPILSGARA